MIVALAFLPLIGAKDPLRVRSCKLGHCSIFSEARQCATVKVLAEHLPVALAMFSGVTWQHILQVLNAALDWEGGHVGWRINYLPGLTMAPPNLAVAPALLPLVRTEIPPTSSR